MLRIVLHTVPRVGRSYEHFPNGFELHLQHPQPRYTLFAVDCISMADAGGASVSSLSCTSSSSLLLSSLQLSDTQVYEPWIRALLATALQFCEVGDHATRSLRSILLLILFSRYRSQRVLKLSDTRVYARQTAVDCISMADAGGASVSSLSCSERERVLY